MDNDELVECFRFLSTESNESEHVREVEEVPSPLHFVRESVWPNRPLIIRRGVEHWTAVNKWCNWKYLKNKIGSKEVTVAVTPNGLADAVYQGNFVMPHEEKMDMSRFLDILSGRVHYKGIAYIQKQNSNLLEEFPELIGDVEEHIEWASQALVHKDHYENIYCVISGYKDFILYRPTDLPWIPYEDFPSAKFDVDADGNFIVKLLENLPKVPWIPVDPLNPDLEHFPSFANATPIQCRIEAGDMLYLPSLWFHHVRQSHGCIAVNYWYDMEFDIKYNYFKFIEMLTSKLSK